MEELLNKLDEVCAQYRKEELDDAGFRSVIAEISTELWQEKQSAMTIVKALVENEDLYDVSLRKRILFAKFICNLLPKTVREKPDYILGIAEIIADFMEEFDEGLSAGDLDAVFSCMPQTPWEDDGFATAAANLVIERAYSLDDLNCISQVIPDSVWKNENELSWLVRSLYNADERNMANLSLFPRKAWESAKVIFEILSCLQFALENDRAWGTVYRNFRGDIERYFDGFLCYVPDKFKSDKDFILELLGYDYFCDAFLVVYNWMDQTLWENKEIVLAALEADASAVLKVSDRMAADLDVRDYIAENVELEWVEHSVPEDKIPQWIKEWIK